MYISEKLIAEAKRINAMIDVVWITDGKISTPSDVRTVAQGSKESLYELATAKVWVDNVRKDLWDRKRQGQYYIQTWHGGTALKKIEKDALDKLQRSYIKRAIRDSKMADVLISESKWNSILYRRAFWFDGEILEYGCPRSDIFYQNNDEYKKKVHTYFKLRDEDKIILYAPTFRNSGSRECYNIDYPRLLGMLSEKWGGCWKVIIRLHPNLAEMQGFIPYGENILNGSEYPDINEIIVTSDLLITDYSSCMFDAMEAKKKIILYASDEESYMGERGTYFQLDELPFPVTHDNEELMDCVQLYDSNKFNNQVREFMDKMGFVNDGKASERCAQLILEKMGLR
jgi:CDP-glycerol glycerophosphotransferase